MKILFKLILIGWLLSSCVHIPLTEQYSIREIRVIGYLDGWRTQEQAENLIKETNDKLIDFGIRLKIIEFKSETFPKGNIEKAVKELENKLEKRSDYDIGIAFLSYHPVELVWNIMVGGVPEGGIDDFFRRYIVIYTLSSTILVHEIYHCFLYGNEHFGGSFKILPILPAVKLSLELSEKQKELLLNRKWRDFNVSPVLEEAKKSPHYNWKEKLFPNNPLFKDE